MKLISWNVNGIRACLNKGFSDFFKEVNADIFCLQETKCQPEQINLEFEDIQVIGIVQKEKDIQEQQYLLKNNQ